MAAKVGAEAPPSTQTRRRRKVHIRIEYTGKGPPGPVLGERCETLVQMLVEGDAGVINERRAGDGTVDIYVITRFADHTVDVARRSTNELGLSARTTISIVQEERAAR